MRCTPGFASLPLTTPSVTDKKQGKVTVVGSTNIDLVAKVPRLPRPGESVGNAVYSRVAGGKGANQAVAAAKGGSLVQFVTSIGEDSFGDESLKNLMDCGVSPQYVHRTDENTGVAIIMVDQDGENAIAVAPGSNHRLLPHHIDEALPALQDADVVALQLEIPMETVMHTLRLCRQLGKVTIVNPAPIPREPLPAEFFQMIGIMVLNETETERLTGVPVFGDMELPNVGARFRKQGVDTVVITLGPKGCYVASPDFEGFLPAFPVKAVDSTGAGDVFCGYLAAALSQGQPMGEAVQIASAAGAICVTRVGAQPSIPYRHEVTEFMGSESF